MKAQPTTRNGKAVPFAEQNEAWQVQESASTVAGFAEWLLKVPFASMPAAAQVAFVATYSPKTPERLRKQVAAAVAARTED